MKKKTSGDLKGEKEKSLRSFSIIEDRSIW